MNMNWIKNILLSGSILILSTLFAIKFADVIVGNFTDSENQNSKDEIKRTILLKEISPNKDYNFKPDSGYMRRTQNLEQKKYRIRTDINGYIVGEEDFSEEKRKQPIDIIFFGGSTTECLFVDEEKRFPYLLQGLLNNKARKSVRTLNGGVSGSHSIHSLTKYIAKGIPLKPKYVALMHNVNDLSILEKTTSYWKAPMSRSTIQKSLTLLITDKNLLIL